MHMYRAQLEGYEERSAHQWTGLNAAFHLNILSFQHNPYGEGDNDCLISTELCPIVFNICCYFGILKSDWVLNGV